MPIIPPDLTPDAGQSAGDITFSGVVDRVFRDWLHGPDEQPIIATLDGTIDSGVTTITVDTSALTPDETDAIAIGLLLEVGYEQMLIQSVSGDDVTVVRGSNGTEASSHPDGVPVVLLPMWGRRTVLDAVLDEVPRLYPDLHATSQVSVTSTNTGYVEVPAVVDVISAAYRVLPSGRYTAVGGLQLLTDFAPSSTGKAVQFSGIPSGQTIFLSYRGSFARPTAGSDTISDYAVDPSWVPIICVGAAASIIASEDLDKTTVEFASRQLEAQQFQIGTGARLRDGMLRYRAYLIDQARRRVRASNTSTAIVYNDAVYVP